MGLFYTIVHTFPEKEPELWLIHDLLHTDMYLISIVDGYILNRDSGEVELLADVQSDLHILTKHTKEEVMTAVKWNNE